MRLVCAFLNLLFVVHVHVCRSSPTTSMAMDKVNTIVHNGENPTAVVFFLHGFGDTAHGWASTFRRVAKDMPHVKFVLPTGRSRGPPGLRTSSSMLTIDSAMQPLFVR